MYTHCFNSTVASSWGNASARSLQIHASEHQDSQNATVSSLLCIQVFYSIVSNHILLKFLQENTVHPTKEVCSILLASCTEVSVHMYRHCEEQRLLTWKNGLIILHGPHHVAEKSTTTSFSPADFSSASNSDYKEKRIENIKDFPSLLCKRLTPKLAFP